MHSMTVLRILKQKFIAFFNVPISPLPLGIFRICMSGFALLQAFVWYPDWTAFFGKDGWIQWEISSALNTAWHIHLQDVAVSLGFLHINETQTVSLFYWFYVVCALGLLIGWHTRVWAILTWLCHYILMSSITTFVYGVDIFLQIGLFYLMVMPVASACSLDALQKRVSSQPTWATTLSLRVLQIHMCLIYFSSGFEKMLAPDWWTGNVLWKALVQPDFRQYDLTWLASHPWLPVSLSVFTMVVETFYGVAMWIPKLRVAWFIGIVALHIGIGLFLGLWLFATIMILLSVSAFGYSIAADVRKYHGTIPLL